MILRKILLFAVVLIIASTTATCAYAENHIGCITVLGDSIASGYGLPDYESGNNYSAPLSWANLIGEQSDFYENFAADGKSSNDLLNDLSHPTPQLYKAIERADTIIISVGGNDFLNRMKSAAFSALISDNEMLSAIANKTISPETIAKYSERILQSAVKSVSGTDISAALSNIEQITSIIIGVKPDAEIILLTIYNPFSGNILLSGLSDAADTALRAFNNGLSEIAAHSEQVRIADVYSIFSDNAAEFTNILKLDIHPSTDGHYEIYQLLYAMLE